MRLVFDGDVIVITGAGRGLGRAHALLLGQLGARVIVNDIGGAADGQGTDAAPAATVADEIEAAGGTAVADTNDGSTVAGAEAMIARTLDEFGRIDGVVANAGILRDQTFHRGADDDFFAVLDVHLGGTVRVFRAAYPHLRDQGHGRLVATTSAAGLWGNFGQTSYSAAKMAIVGFVQALALEGAKRNVLANVVAPAAATRMSESLLGDLAPRLRPELVSPLVAYLCHPSMEATGQIISAGGGRFARVAVGVAAGILQPEPDMDTVAAAFDELLDQPIDTFPDDAMVEARMTFQALSR